MTTSTPVDLVKCVITSTGSGPFIMGAALAGFRGVEALIDGKTYSYSVQLGANYEYGQGLYSLGDASLTRGVTGSSRGGAAVEFGAGAVVTFTLLAADLEAAGISGVLPIDRGGTGATNPTDAREALGIGTQNRYFGYGYADMQNNEVLLRYATTENFTIAANFDAWSILPSGAMPSGPFTVTIAAGAFNVGTITIETSGAITRTTVGSVEHLVTAFSEVTWTAPADAEDVGVGLILTMTGIGITS